MMILLPIPVREYKMSAQPHIRYRQQVDNKREKCILLNEEYLCEDELWKMVARYFITIISRQQWHRE
jgi:hypothetical protein